MKNRLAAALFCIIAGQPAVAAIHAVVLRDGRWSVAAADDCKPAEKVWAWSDEAAPQSIEAARWPGVCAKKSLDRATRTLLLDIVPQDRRARLAILAAPVAMWREVPEALLPRFEWRHARVLSLRRDTNSVWRMRAIGETEGTSWVDVPAVQSKVILGSSVAAARVLRVLTSEGDPAADATVEVVRQRGNTQPEVTACYVTDGRGIVAMPALPDVPPLHFVTHHAAHAVDAFSASTAEFPLTRRLQAGARVRGRVLNGDEPLLGANVALETWTAGDLPKVLTASATTVTDGGFVFEHFPRGALAIVVTKGGFVPHRDTLELKGEGLDLGAIRLERGGSISVRVLDDTDRPVAKAKIDAGSGRGATADADGKVLLEGVSATRPVRITASADGHLTETAELQPPFKDASIHLQRGLLVKGRIADSDAIPIPGASVRIETGPSYRVDETHDDGTFEITLKPNTEARLAFSSPVTTELVVSVTAGNPGEVRDLGTLRAPKGLSVTGRVMGPEGSPVAGARVWSPKQSARGPLVAFMNNEIVEASSAADGTFTVSGLQALPLVLRVDAAGLARGFLDVQLDGSVPSVSVGDISLARGATLRVRTRVSNATARVDSRGEALDIDILTAAVRDGVAVVPHVPTGNATVTIVRHRRTVCEKHVTVEREELTVDCDPVETLVRGVVLIGTTPAREGTLSWTPANAARVAAAIMERRSPNGLRQQQVWGAGDAPVATELDDAGRFETRELHPGRWTVSYRGSTQQVEVPELEEFQISLRFSETALSGVVVDGEGKPVQRALVEIRSANAAMLTREDGSFELHGLTAGEHDVRARSMDGRSATERVRVEEGRDTPALRLVLQEAAAAEVRIAVTRRGVPAAGAFVFADLDGEGQRILTADAAGTAVLRIAEDSHAKRLRVAAFSEGTWAFGEWRGRDQSTISVAIGDGGSLSIAGPGGEVEIVRTDGWNVSQLLRRLGMPPRAGQGAPLLVSGLAPGTYGVSVEGKTQSAEVTSGRTRELAFE